MTVATLANEVASKFLVQALGHAKERMVAWIEDSNYGFIDEVCSLGMVSNLLSFKQETWIKNVIQKTPQFVKREIFCTFEGERVGTWKLREFNHRLYIDFELDPTFVVGYLQVNAEIIALARQKESKYAV